MCRILAIANVKGGVGKTTTAVNLAAALVERGRSVLTVDLDPQSSLTLSLGLDPDKVTRTVRTVIEEGPDALATTVLPVSSNWDVIPGNNDLRAVERDLQTEGKRIFVVGTALHPLRKRYDYMLLDCPANAGPLTGAALAAADEVIIPLTPDYLTYQVTGSLFRIIKEVQKRINPKLRVGGIFLTMYDSRTRHAREILTALHNAYSGEIPLFSAVVHQSVRLKEAPANNQSIIQYAPKSQAAQAYRVIAAEIEEGVRGGVDHHVAASMAAEPAVREVAKPEPKPEPEPDPRYTEFCRLTEIDPRAVDAWVGRANTAPNQDEAIRAYAAAVQLAPTSQDVKVNFEQALEMRALNSTVADVPQLLSLGKDLASKGHISDAEQLFHLTTELSPRNQEAWLERANVAAHPAERIAYIQRCLDLDPENENAQAAMANAKEELRQRAERLAAEGATLAQLGQLSEANARYREAVELDPLDEEAWLGCARTSDNLPAKLSCVKRVLEINPQNAEARDQYSIMNSFVKSRGKDRWDVPAATSLVPVGVVVLAVVISLFVFSELWIHW